MPYGYESQSEQWLFGTLAAAARGLPGSREHPGNIALVAEFDRRFGTRFAEGGVTSQEWKLLAEPGVWVNAINAEPAARAAGFQAGIDNLALAAQQSLQLEVVPNPLDASSGGEGLKDPPATQGDAFDWETLKPFAIGGGILLLVIVLIAGGRK